MDIDTFYVIILVQKQPVLHFPKILVHVQVSQNKMYMTYISSLFVGGTGEAEYCLTKRSDFLWGWEGYDVAKCAGNGKLLSYVPWALLVIISSLISIQLSLLLSCAQ